MYEVRSLTLKDTLLEKAEQRNDDLGRKVAERINSVLCLVAAEARYHQDCYAKFVSNPSSVRKRGRPHDTNFDAAFQEMCHFIDTSEECQFSVHDLMQNINECLPEGDTMTIKTLKNRLTEHYGDGVLFATMPKKTPLFAFVAVVTNC